MKWIGCESNYFLNCDGSTTNEMMLDGNLCAAESLKPASLAIFMTSPSRAVKKRPDPGVKKTSALKWSIYESTTHFPLKHGKASILSIFIYIYTGNFVFFQSWLYNHRTSNSVQDFLSYSPWDPFMVYVPRSWLILILNVNVSCIMDPMGL